MQAQMWPRDEAERQSLVECGWSDRVDKVYRSRDLVHGEDVLFVAAGISDSPLLRGVRVQGSTLITNSVLMRQLTGSVRFIRTEHDLAKRPICLQSAQSKKKVAGPERSTVVDIPLRRVDPAHNSTSARKPAAERVPAFLLFGAPGSGKGTIGRALATLPGCTHCSSGDVIRAAIAESNGKSPHAFTVARGALLSNHELFELFDDFLATYRMRTWNEAAHLVIDGIPRCSIQVEPLEERVEVRGVFYLDCGDPKILVERLRRRFAATGRSDDADEAVMIERLRLFQAETLPLLEEYPRELLHRIDATQAPALVLRDILNCFEAPATRYPARELARLC